jgi:pimeloyl-ACP methyl ester carboxylesterase
MTSPREVGPASAIWAATSGIVGCGHVVLVHGSLDRSTGLLRLSRRLDAMFRVSRYDRRGYGRSMPHHGPFGIEQQVDDLVGVLRREAAPAVLVGHSYGGNVALAAAQRHPSLVAGVVVYEAPLAWFDWWPASTAGADARESRDDPETAAERFMRRLIGDQRWERLPAATQAARRAEGPALVGELGDLHAHAPWTHERVRVPVAPMCGEHSADHHRRSAHVLAKWFRTEPVVVPGARHFGPNTHPDETSAAVTAFAEGLLRR